MNVSIMGPSYNPTPPSADGRQVSGEADRTGALPEPQLQSLANGPDLGAAIAAMVMMTAKESKKAARTARDAAYASMEAAQRDQLAHMREEAEAKFIGGMASGIATVGSGALSIGGGMSDAAAATHQAEVDRMNKVGEGASRTEEFARQNAAGTASWLNGGSTGLQGAGKITETAESFSAEHSGEAAKGDEMRADAAKRSAEAARDDIDDAKDVLKKAMDFYKEYTTAKNDAQKAAFLRA